MAESENKEDQKVNIGHPRGTLAILIIYGVLFTLGWLALYFFEFMQRGAPHP